MKRKRIQHLFGEFTKTAGLPTKAKWRPKKREHSRDFVNLDYNPNYGGYRFDIVKKSTGETFFAGSKRRSPKEMEAYLEGLVHGAQTMKKKKRERLGGTLW
jgi:hypothetical protein